MTKEMHDKEQESDDERKVNQSSGHVEDHEGSQPHEEEERGKNQE
jgi:hypothetical protein